MTGKTAKKKQRWRNRTKEIKHQTSSSAPAESAVHISEIEKPPATPKIAIGSFFWSGPRRSAFQATGECIKKHPELNSILFK